MLVCAHRCAQRSEAPFPISRSPRSPSRCFVRQTSKGQPTLMVFSANWDSHNYYLRQQLRKLKAARGNRLRIINFALDESLEKAEERAKNDSLQSVVYLKNMLANPLVKTLGMRYPSGQYPDQCARTHHRTRFPHRRTRRESQRTPTLKT